MKPGRKIVGLIHFLQNFLRTSVVARLDDMIGVSQCQETASHIASLLNWPILGWDSMGHASAKRPRSQPDRGELITLCLSSGERVNAGRRATEGENHPLSLYLTPVARP